MANGWTGAWTSGLIAPDQRVHDAAHAAVDSTGGSVSAALRNQVLTGGLRDATLGSRTVGGATSAPLGAPVGSSSVYQNAGIPDTIRNAIGNLNTNTQNSSISAILNQVLHGLSGGNAPSPAQNALFQAQTEQINQNMQTASGPARFQAQLDAIAAKQAAAAAVNPLANRSTPIGVRPTAQNNYDWTNQQNAYTGLANAATAQANGWISQPYTDPALNANAVRNQQSAMWDAGRVVY